jgi:heme-degrading monooxygenase HmoA
MHSRIARYGYTGDAHEIARRAEAELLPRYQQMAGFKAFTAAVTEDELFSFTVWETADQAEAASTTAAGWVSESGFELAPRELHIAEVVLSTTLGVSAPAAV